MTSQNITNIIEQPADNNNFNKTNETVIDNANIIESHSTNSSSAFISKASDLWPAIGLHELTVKWISIFSSPFKTKSNDSIDAKPNSNSKLNKSDNNKSKQPSLSSSSSNNIKTQHYKLNQVDLVDKISYSNTEINTNFNDNTNSRYEKISRLRYTNKNKQNNNNKLDYLSDMSLLSSSSKSSLLSLSSPSFLYLTSTASTSLQHHSSQLNHLAYKNNELYSIFVSMFTAAIFLLFIMWRWIRMKSDLRKALREQIEIQQQEQLNSSSRQTSTTSSSASSSNLNRWSPSYHHPLLNSSNREQLQATAASLIAQLANGEARTPAQHQQMIDTAKYCLQQLRLQTRLARNNIYNNHANREHDYLSNYFTFNSRYDRDQPANTTLELSCSRNATTAFSPTDNSLPIPESLSSLSNADNSYNNQSVYNFLNATSMGYQRTSINEQPPPYESIMTKSSSLPSYCTIKKADNKKTFE